MSPSNCRLIPGLLIIFFFLSCEEKKEIKETPANEISVAPAIEIKEISPLTLKQFDGVLKITIQYTDGDGDLGFSDADEKSLEVTDQRADLVHRYHVPPLAPDTQITITGTLVIEVDHVILIDQEKESESAKFAVRIKDRAGNWSNTAVSSDVLIVK